MYIARASLATTRGLPRMLMPTESIVAALVVFVAYQAGSHFGPRLRRAFRSWVLGGHLRAEDDPFFNREYARPAKDKPGATQSV